MKIQTIAKGAAVVLVTVALAYVLGSQTGNLLADRRERDARFVRTQQTEELLDQMGTIQVGNTLPDHTFQGLDRQYHRLSDLLQDHTLISIFDYHCDNCLKELQQYMKVVRDSNQAKHIVLISGSNPLQLIELRDTYSIPFRILYDEDAMFLTNHNITTFPFNIVVNRSMQIEQIAAGSLMEDEIRQLWREDK
jgi:peroxiredoxin